MTRHLSPFALGTAALASATLALAGAQSAAAAPSSDVPASADYYVNVQLAPSPSFTKPAGTVSFAKYPGVRAADSATVTITTLGFTTWKRTFTTDTLVNLPHPYLFAPQTLTADVLFTEPTGEAIHKTLTKSWVAYR